MSRAWDVSYSSWKVEVFEAVDWKREENKFDQLEREGQSSKERKATHPRIVLEE